MNVVWIVIDSLRADHLGCYGYPRPTSPHLDRLARECVRFEQLISPHIPTQPAHTTIFTGRDVFDHQIVAQGGLQELDPSLRLLPDLLRERGWFTGAVDNIGRWIEPAFERYEKYPRWGHDGALPWRNGEEVTARALDLLREASGRRQPFFLFFHYWDPHTPYLPPAPFDRMFYGGDERSPGHRSMEPVWASPWFANYFREWLEGVRDIEYVKAQYDASIAYADTCLAHVFNRLGELGLWDDTLLLVQSDHGEELDDHGCWFDHHGLYDTNVRIPLLARFPDRRGAGTAVSSLASLLDLAPTVLDALALPELAAGMGGRSLLPLVGPKSQVPSPKSQVGGPEAGDQGPEIQHPNARTPERLNAQPAAGIYLTECTWMRKRGWRTEEWKLIEALEPDIYGKPALELYHLPSDPTEQRNLAAERPEVAAKLREARDRHVAARLEERARESGSRKDPIEEQAEALRIWQPRFIAGKQG